MSGIDGIRLQEQLTEVREAEIAYLREEVEKLRDELRQRQIDAQSRTVDIQRALADGLEKMNVTYERHPTGGSWSPETLRYEADYLEANP